jgi:hypothetical protein
VFIAFESRQDIEIGLSDLQLPGIMALFNSQNARVAKRPRQIAEEDFGVDEFDFWLPRRRPHQVMPALRFATPFCCYAAENLLNGRLRPERQINAWVPALDDTLPQVNWQWDRPQTITSLTLVFDNDFDNAMETVQMGHDAAVTPHCTTQYRLWADGRLIADVKENHLSLCQHVLEEPLSVSCITLELMATAGALPALYSLNVK